MPSLNTPRTIAQARRLRRNMTEGERKLWSELQQFRAWYGIHVRKQVPISPYIVDFAVHSHRLVIEVDGEHHFSLAGLERDQARDEWLKGRGYRILRFNTGELREAFDGGVEEVLRALGLMERHSTPGVAPTPPGVDGNRCS